MQTRYEDLYDAVAVVGTEQPLVGRLDSAVAGVGSTESTHKKVTGFMGRCANTGYLVFRLAGVTIATIDLAVMNALTGFSPLDIDVPVGQTFSIGEMSSSGTALCSCTVRYEVP